MVIEWVLLVFLVTADQAQIEGGGTFLTESECTTAVAELRKTALPPTDGFVTSWVCVAKPR